MAKTFDELFGALQKAVTQADKDRAAAQDARADAAAKRDVAKAAYEAVVADTTAQVDRASALAAKSDERVRELRGEVNHVLGRFDQADTRVRQG